MFSQCGGLYASGRPFDGPSDCGSLGKCVELNSFYYQCVPKEMPTPATINKTIGFFLLLKNNIFTL